MNASPSPESVRRGRIKLALLGAFFALPFVLGTLAWWLDWAPGTTSNYGELVSPPLPLAGPPFDALRGKWLLVSFDTAACDAYCEKKLYFMRQVRRAQGKDQDRVERLWVLTDAAQPRAELLAAIEGTRIARSQSLAAQFPAAPLAADHIYVVDPLGNLMMRYARDPDPSRMLKDLQRLLKVSRIG
ncbi:MAG TPA: cytochrome C oxidase subunit I [Burkholderiales bacterium]|nr:cytochrome C oxidase subunit I [Burkholderiales bacterium]